LIIKYDDELAAVIAPSDQKSRVNTAFPAAEANAYIQNIV